MTVTDPTNTAPGGPTYNSAGKQIGGVFNPYSPQQAIPLEAFFMSQLLKQFGGDPTKALEAYNAGPNDLAAGAG
ncbi:lytic transglycosylase domain-containing protein, partial [Bradyrhizobium sp. 25ACV]